MNKVFARVISGLIPFRNLRRRVRNSLIHGGTKKEDGGRNLSREDMETIENRFIALRQLIQQGQDMEMIENRFIALEQMIQQVRDSFPASNSLDDSDKILLAKQIFEFRKQFPPPTIRDAEIDIFSQWGEDGIIQWIMGRIPNPVPMFVEFRVENYQKSNTRFLLLNNNWRGLILTDSRESLDYVQTPPLRRRPDLTVFHSPIDRYNINELISSCGGFSGEIGILSVDMGGVDYWVLKNIDAVTPQIIICKFNALFGGELAVTVPYKKDFDRLKEHCSCQYWGASLKAMEMLLKDRGYFLLGINSSVTSAFFARNDLSGYFSPSGSLSPSTRTRYGDASDTKEDFTRIRDSREKLHLIADMPLFDISAGILAEVSDLFKLSSEELHSPAIPKMEKVIKAPYKLFSIELTNRCVMRCIMCPRTNRMTRPLGDIDMGMYKQIIDQYVNDNKDSGNEPIWLHCFGESLLHPHFDECISYAASKGLKPSLSINPIMLKDDVRKRLLNSNPYFLLLSMDGGDEPTFARLRGVVGKYEESKKNALKFLDDKVRTQNPVKVWISVIHMNNYGQQQIKGMEDFWNEQDGVDMFHLKPFTNWNGDIAEIDGLGELPELVPCHWPFSSLAMAWDGTIMPCCYDYDTKYSLGNVKDISIISAWNSSKMQSLREEFISGNVTNRLCALCRSGGKYFDRNSQETWLPAVAEN